MTEGIRYTGSKKEILPKILELTKRLDVKNILDGFGGTTRVSQMYKIAGYNVDCNDLAEYTQIFAKCYLLNKNPKSYYEEKIKYLNSLPGYRGWYSENYGGDPKKSTSIGEDGLKKPWQLHNTTRLDAIRDEIDKISGDDIEKSVLLTSLVMALDKVDNTLGHQVAYLKDWSGRSFNKLELKVPNLLLGSGNYNVFKGDIFDIKGGYDLIYLDPPYGTNNEKTKTTRVRYASYYHLWTTIIKNDKPQLVGKSKRRYEFSSDTLPGAVSVFESTNYDRVKGSIDKLLELDSKYFIFSYNNKSKVKISDLVDIFSQHRLLETIEFSHKENVMKKLTSNKEWLGDQNKNLEYLFLIEKKG
jgi:adenine-specific DNA-methyltransferase